MLGPAGNRDEIVRIALKWIQLGVGVVPLGPQPLSGKLSYVHTDPRWRPGDFPFLTERAVRDHWARRGPDDQLGLALAHPELTIWLIDDHRDNLVGGGPADPDRSVSPPNDVYHELRPGVSGCLHVLFATRVQEITDWTWQNPGPRGCFVKGNGPVRDGDQVHGSW